MLGTDTVCTAGSYKTLEENETSSSYLKTQGAGSLYVGGFFETFVACSRCAGRQFLCY